MGIFTQKDDEAQLATAHPDLVRIVREAVKRSPYNWFVVYGHRSIQLQQQLYAQGRTRRGRIVTMLDGVTHKSRHNYIPSLAVDLAPAEVVATGRWLDTAKTNAQFNQLGEIAEAVAKEMGITDFRWGGRFRKPVDKPHYELTRKV